MHGQNHIKIKCAKQAKTIHEYKSRTRRLYKTTAANRYNKTCREKHLTPKYISIRINGNNRQGNNTLKVATRYRINKEIQFLNIKKPKLNQQLYIKHLECAAQWSMSWITIQQSNDILQHETETDYENLNKKLDDLQANSNKRSKNTTCDQQQSFYPRTINHRDTIFTREEQELLYLGAQCSIQQSLKNYWNNLVVKT
jgi:uncharacterized membrane protein YheB (UPF0754 family)